MHAAQSLLAVLAVRLPSSGLVMPSVLAGYSCRKAAAAALATPAPDGPVQVPIRIVVRVRCWLRGRAAGASAFDPQRSAQPAPFATAQAGRDLHLLPSSHVPALVATAHSAGDALAPSFCSCGQMLGRSLCGLAGLPKLILSAFAPANCRSASRRILQTTKQK